MFSVKRVAIIIVSAIATVLVALSAFAITAGTAGAATGKGLDDTQSATFNMPNSHLNINHYPGLGVTVDGSGADGSYYDGLVAGGWWGVIAVAGSFDSNGNGGRYIISGTRDGVTIAYQDGGTLSSTDVN